MKIRLADYIADFLVEHGINKGFTVVGGGAMHLNDAFGHKKGLKMLYNHHEQGSAIAADGYARITNKPALLCVTTGPGGINAMTGVCAAYVDSIPMFVVSGQVRYDTSSVYERKITGAILRCEGDQEYDIVPSVKNMTKYAVMIEDPNTIRFHLERAYTLATTGRMGPVWLDVPVNFQGTTIETKNLKSYFGSKEEKEDKKLLPPKFDVSYIKKVIDMIKVAKRPVIYVGYGLRLSGACDLFKKLIEKLNIPVATCWDAIDVIENDNKLFCGRAGNMDERAGNFAVQNSDLVIVIGSRLSVRQTGYEYKTWARAAKVVMVDIDKEEFKKHTIHTDLTIWADAYDFVNEFYKVVSKSKEKLFKNSAWNEQCIAWRKKYKVVDESKFKAKNKTNVYAFLDVLSASLPNNSISIATSGASCIAGHQAYHIKKGTRFINNNVIATMGYGLPASIGACIANKYKSVIGFEGDGGIMMNIQELQTVVTNKLPIKIFLINNDGYHAIRITQNNMFKGRSKVGIGEESGDLSFPNYEKVTKAFGLKYIRINKNSELKTKIKKALDEKGPIVVEVMCDKEQVWEPKCIAKKLPDGRIISPPLEDMAPFLPHDEFIKNMYIDPIS